MGKDKMLLYNGYDWIDERLVLYFKKLISLIINIDSVDQGRCLLDHNYPNNTLLELLA